MIKYVYHASQQVPCIIIQGKLHSNLFAETCMFAILHTWGQKFSYHPHLHCVVPGCGIDFKGNWKHVKVSASIKVFLFNMALC
jgi:hypothetical protein